MDVAQRGKELRHDLLRLSEAAAQHLDVRPHGDGLAEDDKHVLLPEELLDHSVGLLEVLGALWILDVIDLACEAQQKLNVRLGHHAPARLQRIILALFHVLARLRQLREKALVHLDRLGVLLADGAYLRPLEAARHVELHDVWPGVRHRREELLVDLRAFGVLRARVVRVAHREADGPVFAAALLAGVKHLLDLLEPAHAQVTVDLIDLELRRQDRPLRLGRGDHRPCEVWQVRLNERLHIGELLFRRRI